MFDQYRIDKVEIEFYPEYTVLSDSGLASNAVNVQLNTAIDPVGYTITTVNDVLQYKTLKATGITKQHKRVLSPMYLIDDTVPINAFITTSKPSVNWYGLVYGVPPTGVAMTLRSRVKFYLSMLISR